MFVITFNYFKLGYSSIVFHIKRKVRQMKDSHQVFSSRKYIVKRTVPLILWVVMNIALCDASLFSFYYISLSCGFCFKCNIEVEVTTLYSLFITKDCSSKLTLFLCLNSLLTYEKGLKWIFFRLSVYLYVFYKKVHCSKTIFLLL